MILLALCWTPSGCFVFLRAVSVCKSPTDFGWELTSAGRKGIIAPLARCLHCGDVCIRMCATAPTCFKLTEARLPSLCLTIHLPHSLSCAGTGAAVALWQATANQEAHPKLKQINVFYQISFCSR